MWAANLFYICESRRNLFLSEAFCDLDLPVSILLFYKQIRFSKFIYGFNIYDLYKNIDLNIVSSWKFFLEKEFVIKTKEF